MKKIIVWICVYGGLIQLSCDSNKEEYDHFVEIIPVNLNKSKTSPIEEVIEKIELIPLETNKDCLLHTYRKMEYYKDLEMFAVFDENFTVYLFSKEGKFITNSKELYGQGPRQFQIIVDFLYNPYSKCMEFLGPWGTIYRYDTSFRFIEKISLEQQDLIFHNFLPISKTQYLLAHSHFSLSDAVLFFCDFDTKTINTASYEKYYIGGPSMQNQTFLPFEDQILFLPIGFDYHFYQVKYESFEVVPIIKLDFGSDEITRRHIERTTGISYKNRKQNNRNRDSNSIANMLVESNHPFPISKYINNNYVYIHIFTNHKRSNYIYNRKTKKGYYQATDDEFKISFGLQMEDNVLITMPQPYEIEKYLNKNYMSQRDIEIMENILEDDNPIIVKYYLK